FSSRRRHTRSDRDWSSDVCSSDLDCRRAVWADAIAPRGRGTGDCYVAAYETPAPFLYAEKVVKPEDAPQDWDDLLDPKWKGKLIDRKSTRLNSSHDQISYAVFCLK